MTEYINNSVQPAATESIFPYDFSIIIPCFNEEASIREFHERLTSVLEKMNCRFEIVYVNDGSTDGTLASLRDIHTEQQLPICVLDLAQNVGQTNAMTAGFQYASGKHIIFLDCDLQVAPEDIRLLIDIFDDSYDMVSGVRVQRKDNLLRVYLSRMGNAFIRRVLGLPLYDFGSGMKILNGMFIRAFEPGPFRPINPGVIMLSLRHIREVPIKHQARESGHTRWTPRRFFTLYHNIFTHLVPFIYPFTVVPMLIVSLLLWAYFLLAVLYPDTVPYAERPAVVPMLVMFNIALSFVVFLLLGEFVLRGGGHAQEPAYIVRYVLPARNSPEI